MLDEMDGDPTDPHSQLWKEKNELIAPFFTEAGSREARKILTESLENEGASFNREDVDEATDELLSRISNVADELNREVDDPKEPAEAKTLKAQRDRYEQEERLEKKLLKRAQLVLSDTDVPVEPITWLGLSQQIALEEIIEKRDEALLRPGSHLRDLRKLGAVYSEAHSLGIALPTSPAGIQERLDWLNVK